MLIQLCGFAPLDGEERKVPDHIMTFEKISSREGLLVWEKTDRLTKDGLVIFEFVPKMIPSNDS